MPASRQIRKRVIRSKRKPLELDITSLLDILVIILVFLLKSYNSSGVIIDIPDDINPPNSKSQSLNNPGVKLVISQNKIFIDDQVAADLSRGLSSLLVNDNLIGPLYEVLVKKREASQVISETVGQGQTFSGIINLVMDKELKYDFLRKVMYTAGEAGFIKFKFVVLSEIQ